MKTSRLTGIITAAIAVFVLIGINTFFQPCSGEKLMACNYSAKAATLVLALAAVLGIFKAASSEKRSRILFDIAGIVIAAELLLIPKLIGSCKMASMTCNARTVPALTIGGLLLGLLALISVIAAAASPTGSEKK